MKCYIGDIPWSVVADINTEIEADDNNVTETVYGVTGEHQQYRLDAISTRQTRSLQS
jgi:hypothetical protein